MFSYDGPHPPRYAAERAPASCDLAGRLTRLIFFLLPPPLLPRRAPRRGIAVVTYQLIQPKATHATPSSVVLVIRSTTWRMVEVWACPVTQCLANYFVPIRPLQRRRRCGFLWHMF